MGHTLQLELPDDIYESLLQSAQQTGQRPESVAMERLIIATRGLVDDPLEQFIGAFPSDTPDWADQHDHYIGAAILEQGRNADGEGVPRG